MRLVALAGGTGAAKLLRGLDALVEPGALTIIGNTGDDEVFHGLHVSPDLDTICYTLAGLIDESRGWGLRDESFRTLGEMVRFGEPTWFNLGDRDLATHLHRTRLLAEGVTLGEVTARLARDLGARHAVLPMSDQPVRTRLLGPDGWLSFQEYFVREKTQVEVREVEYTGAAAATPSPGLLEAIVSADAVLVCPSNPVTSIGPILAVPGLVAALHATRAPVIGVSPIVGDAPVSGPAGALMRARGLPVSSLGVAQAYRGWLDSLVVDVRDAQLASALRDLGIASVVADILMTDHAREVALARVVLEGACA